MRSEVSRCNEIKKTDDAFVRCIYLNTYESVFAANIYLIVIVLASCNIFICQNSQKQSMALVKLNNSFVEALSHLWPLNNDGYGLPVTQIKDFMFSLAENYDIKL